MSIIIHSFISIVCKEINMIQYPYFFCQKKIEAFEKKTKFCSKKNSSFFYHYEFFIFFFRSLCIENIWNNNNNNDKFIWKLKPFFSFLLNEKNYICQCWCQNKPKWYLFILFVVVRYVIAILLLLNVISISISFIYFVWIYFVFFDIKI